MRMIRTSIMMTLTTRKMVRAPQRRGASFEGTFGFSESSPLVAVGFCPGTASSTPSLEGTGLCIASGPLPISGLIREGAVLLRSVRMKISMYIHVDLPRYSINWVGLGIRLARSSGTLKNFFFFYEFS